jgi:O-antigen ligase
VAVISAPSFNGRYVPRARAGLIGAALMVLCAGWLGGPLYVVIAFAGTGVLLLTMRYPVAGFGLLAFSVPWSSGTSLPLASSLVSPTELIVAALTGAWFARAASERRSPVAGASWTPYVALFLLAIALSLSQATDSHASFREIVKWLELGMVYGSAAYFLRTRRDVMLVVALLVAAGVSQALLGFIQFGLHLGPQAFASQRLFLRAYGTFDQPNPYAGYLNMILPLALAMALLGTTGAARRWYAVATLLLGGAMLASESRGALLAAVVALSIVLACASRSFARLFWLGVLVACGTALLAAFGLPLGPISRVLDAIGLSGVNFGSVTDANYAAVERAAHWLAGVRMFAAHPLLGVGIGNYGAAYPAYHPRGWYPSLEHAHNYYINVAAEAGIVGLAAYLLLAGSALWYSGAAMRWAYTRVYRAVGLGVTGALIATNFHNIFDVLYVHGTTALIGLLMGLTAIGFRSDEVAISRLPAQDNER